MLTFDYPDEVLIYLSARCAKMGALIKKHGKLTRTVEPNLFKALISSIISQQISTKAAQTVFAKVCDLVGDLTPGRLLEMSDENIKSCGVSYRKIGYMKGICEAVQSGALALDELPMLPNDAFIHELTQLKGVGVWTAEMLLIFSLSRLDILSFGDLAIRNGLMKLHALSELSKDDFKQYDELYAPYGSVASFYLWAHAND